MKCRVRRTVRRTIEAVAPPVSREQTMPQRLNSRLFHIHIRLGYAFPLRALECLLLLLLTRLFIAVM